MPKQNTKESRKNTKADPLAKLLEDPKALARIKAILSAEEDEDEEPRQSRKNNGKAGALRIGGKAGRKGRDMDEDEDPKGSPKDAARAAFKALGLKDGKAPKGFRVPDTLYPGRHVSKVLYAAAGGDVTTLGPSSDLGNVARGIMGSRPSPEDWEAYNAELAKLTAAWLESL